MTIRDQFKTNTAISGHIFRLAIKTYFDLWAGRVIDAKLHHEVVSLKNNQYVTKSYLIDCRNIHHCINDTRSITNVFYIIAPKDINVWKIGVNVVRREWTRTIRNFVRAANDNSF